MKKLTYLTTSLFVAMTMAAVAGTDTKDMKSIAAPEQGTGDAGIYVGLFGGANVSQDYGDKHTEINTPLLASTSLTLKGNDNSNHIGGVGGIKFGYNFDSFPIGGDFRLQPAVEAEAFYMGTKTNVSYNTAVVGVPISASIGGNQNDAVFSVNGLLRLKTGTLFTPYIGGGIGEEYLSLSSPRANTNVGGYGFGLSYHDSDDVCLALQAIGGFDYEICKHWTLFTEYKFVATIDPSLNLGDADLAAAGVNVNTKFNPDYIGQHLVTAGVKYSF